MTVRIAVLVATRADLGPLVPVLAALAGRSDVAVEAWTAVGFDEPGLGRELARSGLDRVPVRSVGPAHLPASWAGVTAVGAATAAGVGTALAEARPDAVVVLGDRWELLFMVPPVVLEGLPLVHLHGGETTEGAVDDKVRYAVTALADAHCVATEDAAARLLAAGVAPSAVHLTGAPGLDRLLGTEPCPQDELEALLGQPLRRPLALCTVHPATATQGPPPGVLARLVLDETCRAAATVLVTHPGPDPGREEVLAEVEAAGRRREVVVVPSLGADYPRVMAACDLVVGNSSSGIIEAASFGLPAVDVGDRQAGRTRGSNVLSARADSDALREALQLALSEEFGARAAQVRNPYGDGCAAPRIADVVVAAADRGQR